MFANKRNRTKNLSQTRFLPTGNLSRECKAPFTRYNLLSNRLCRVYKHSTGLTTGLTTGCIVYVKPVVQPGLTTG